MKLATRNITVRKSVDEVYQILRSSAFRGDFQKSEGSFQLRCAKRDFSGQFLTAIVRGTVLPCSEGTKITLTLHANAGVWIGVLSILYGFLHLLLSGLMYLLSADQFVWSGVMNILFGAIVAVFMGGREVEQLDSITHKLSR